jgi:hypothetical protein
LILSVFHDTVSNAEDAGVVALMEAVGISETSVYFHEKGFLHLNSLWKPTTAAFDAVTYGSTFSQESF